VSVSGARLFVVCGLPGSGKTTHALQLEREHRAVRMCPDEWMSALAIGIYDEAARARVEALQWTLGQRLLALGLPVIIEWGTWAREERDALRLTARAMGAAVELHVLTAPIQVLFERLRGRNAETPPIELADLQNWAQIFQVPTEEEMAHYDRCVAIPAEL
jgi:predicted kinase